MKFKKLIVTVDKDLVYFVTVTNCNVIKIGIL